MYYEIHTLQQAVMERDLVEVWKYAQYKREGHLKYENFRVDVIE